VGRKARDLPQEDRPAAGVIVLMTICSKGVVSVKANLARFTLALVVIASLALTLGAGMRWG
jgi:hypothetical protein